MKSRSGPVRYHPEYYCGVRIGAGIVRGQADAIVKELMHGKPDMEQGTRLMAQLDLLMRIECEILAKVGTEPTPIVVATQTAKP